MAPVVIRSLPLKEPTLFLTFDDGPCDPGTPQVLDVLAHYSAHATFFVVGENARANPDLISRIVSAGHALGNHSLNHSYRNYFRGEQALTRWVSECESIIHDFTGEASAGFRPPAGVRTPPLRRAVRSLGMPMILWNTRFYDSVRPWRESAAAASLARAKNGDIVLLHDRQTDANRRVFLKTLEFYIGEARRRGFRFATMARPFASK